MSSISNTVTSAFLNELAKDKSQIKTINPKVIFRRILGVGENVDRSDVIRALQNHAKSCGKLDLFRNNLIDKSLVGEVISFDIGTSPTWVKFIVSREPLPKPKVGATINFIISVTDRKNCKKYTRLIGAIANEADENGNRSPVFRTISDMCEEDEIPPEVNAESLKALKDLDEIIIKKGQLVAFVKLDSTHAKIVDYPDVGIEEHYRRGEPKVLWEKLYTDDTHDLDGGENLYFFYRANNDVRRALLEQCGIVDILVEFDKVESHSLIMIPEGSKVNVVFKESTNSLEILPTDSAIGDHILGSFVIQDRDGFVRGEFEATTNITGAFFDANPVSKPFDKDGWLAKGFKLIKAENVVEVPDPKPAEEPPAPPEEPKPAEEEPSKVESAVDEEALKNMQPDTPAAAIADIDTQEQEPPKVIFTAGEAVNFEEDPDGIYIAKQDVTTDMWDSIPVTADKMQAFFTRQDKQPKKEEQPMNELYAKKGDVIEVGGVKCTVNEDIPVDYVKEHNGDVSAMVTPVETQQPAGDSPDAATPIGDVPDTRDIRSSITPVQHCQVLFGTTSPSFMHVMEFLKTECANSEIYKITGTFPPEQISVIPVEIAPGKVESFTYATLRMKNGAYYRVMVSFTDKDALANPALAGEYAWTKTRDDKSRWMKVIDIQDREVSNINNRRRV